MRVRIRRFGLSGSEQNIASVAHEFTQRIRAIKTAWNQEVASTQFEDLCQRFPPAKVK